MTRSKVGARLSEYLEGDLSEKERSKVEAALDADPTLREELRELESMRTLLRGLPEPEVPVAFATRVIAHVQEAEAQPRSPLEWLRGVFEPAVAMPLAAGITAVALFIGVQDGVTPALDGTPAHLQLAEAVAAPGTPSLEPAPPQPARLAAAAPGEPELSLNEVQQRTLQTILSRSRHEDLARLLRGSGHPLAASLASDFESDGNLQVVSAKGRRRR